MSRRVVVTGIGAIAPNGEGADAFFQNCLDGVFSAAPVPEHWHHYGQLSSQVWAPLPSIDYSTYGVTRVDKMQLDPTGIMGIAGGVQALSQAGIATTCINERKGMHRLERIDPMQAGVYIGTGIGGLTSLIGSQANHVLTPVKKSCRDITRKINGDCAEAAAAVSDLAGSLRMPPRFNPFIVSMTMPNACAGTLGIRFGIKGPNETTCHACAAGTIALGHAFNSVKAGHITMALAGGVEYLTDEFGGIYRGFDIAGTLASSSHSPDSVNRPFDRDRSGFLFAEGGCSILVLEELSHALERGAEPVAEILGFAESFDAHSLMMMEPSGEQIERMFHSLLQQAGLTPDSIDYINTHGTGTELNDRVEAETIGRTFRKKPLIGATKSLIGHTLGASGALATSFTALALKHQKLHACKNLDNPEHDLNFVHTPGSYEIQNAIVQSFAFGGHNAALLMRRYAE